MASCHSAKNNTTDSNIILTDSNYLVTGYYYLSKDSDKYKRQLYGTTTEYSLDPIAIITVDNFTSVFVDKNNSGNYYIYINLNEPGGQKWSEGTARATGDSLAIVINNELVQVAYVNGQIIAPVTAINRSGLTKSLADKYLTDIKAKMKK